MTNDTDYGVLDPALAIESMRSNGYLSTDTALAELIDNAVDANASVVEVFCFEHTQEFGNTRRRRVGKIGVLDDGDGMDADTLRLSLRFGGGRRQDRTTIGRFGFGLPNSSISQTDNTTVWSWQTGHTNALKAYLNVPEIQQGTYREVPAPTPAPLPQPIAELSERVGKTGTYVEWDQLTDGVTWKRSSTVLEHTEFLVGRIYRHYLTREHDPLRIVMHIVSPQGEVTNSQQVRVNDPLYLSKNTSAPWDDEPMFQPYSENDYAVRDSNGIRRHVRVTLSYATSEARQPVGGQAAGALEHGKHAAKNQGISVVRNDRELQLADVIKQLDFRDRWIGCEIRFPAELDEVLGVANNKQEASNLIHYIGLFNREDAPSLDDMRANGEIDYDDPELDLMQLAAHVAGELRVVADAVKHQRKGERDGKTKRHDPEVDPVEDRANKVTRRRAQDHPTQEEQREIDHPTPLEEQRTDLLESFIANGHPPEVAERLVERTIRADHKVIFLQSPPDKYTDEIFDVQTRSGARTEIVLNASHPAFEDLVDVLDLSSLNGGIKGASPEELAERIVRASDNLRMLFAAWARVEVEKPPGSDRKRVARIRQDWGRLAAAFLEEDFDEDSEDEGH